MLPGSTTLSEDDITFALSNILKVNITIMGDVHPTAAREAEKYRGKATNDMSADQDMLQIYYSNYIDNERAGVVRATQKNKRPLKTFRQRIKVGAARGAKA